MMSFYMNGLFDLSFLKSSSIVSSAPSSVELAHLGFMSSSYKSFYLRASRYTSYVCNKTESAADSITTKQYPEFESSVFFCSYFISSCFCSLTFSFSSINLASFFSS
jgi:hypothetical protein